MKLKEFDRLFRAFLAGVTVPDGTVSNTGVLAVDVNHARYISRDVVFVTGLEEGAFPAGDASFSLHTAEIAGEVDERRRSEEPLLFYMSACGAKRLYLTFPGIDDEGSDNRMSPYLREIQEGTHPWCPPVFHPRIPGSDGENGSPNERGWSERLVRMMKSGSRPVRGLFAAVGKMRPAVGEVLERAVGDCLGRMGGMAFELGGTGPFASALADWDGDRVFSVSDLETYIECPVKFFLTRLIGLRVEPPVTGDIDPAVRGMIVHYILAGFYRRRLEEAGSTRFSRDEMAACLALIRSVTERVFTSSMRTVSGIHPVTRAAIHASLQDAMVSFVRHEARYFEETDFEPVDFEVAFGGRHGNGEHRRDPLTIGEGDDAVMISGRIDRIDRKAGNGKDAVRIIDYKTGAVDAGLSDLRTGTSLQLPLYLDAVRSVVLPDAVIADGVYMSFRDMALREITSRGRRLTADEWEDCIASARGAAVAAACGIRAGSFPPADGKCGRRCEFRPYCRWGLLSRSMEDGE